MLVAIYTHYLGLFILAAHYAFFALHYRRIKPLFLQWLMGTAGIGLFFAFWALVMIRVGGLQDAVNAPGWIPTASLYEPILTFLAPSAGPSLDQGNLLGYAALAVYLLALGVIYLRYARCLPADYESDSDAGRGLESLPQGRQIGRGTNYPKYSANVW